MALKPTTNSQSASCQSRHNGLNTWQGGILLTAECMGTGLLALPHNVKVLGKWFGISFILFNLFINQYAGTILSQSATRVEERQASLHPKKRQQKDNKDVPKDSTNPGDIENERTPLIPVDNNTDKSISSARSTVVSRSNSISSTVVENETEYVWFDVDDTASLRVDKEENKTTDFIGMAASIFRGEHQQHDSPVVGFVMLLYYTNVYLVLGNYILVMSHAVSSVFGGKMCIPIAGLVASTVMFGLAQMRTMDRLGRSTSIVSLLAMFIVIGQCVYFSAAHPASSDDAGHSMDALPVDPTIIDKLSSMGSIGFAVGSQKLLLNIRHDLADRSTAPQSLAMALTAFGAVYVFVSLSAGENPPSFLFDAIPSEGIHRRVAGLCLWIHVAVSYAINSQAICSSMDRLFFKHWDPVRCLHDDRRWMLLSGVTASSAFFVANSIPFFKDLVGLTGALTSVPLTLLLPAVYHRKLLSVPIWKFDTNHLPSFGLMIFSILFMVSALIGSVRSIMLDWENNKVGFFPCTR
ncbi:unnamed protein product [Cylindrotheca closterium]|uniref:Amino acid transporter transmembrane domain-containing protein n=1 Tax=Cylindrotheca closterium TaxID=2856 RepID=A0AAD2CML7_9STRA|nr:unnamed protein product [Cylindrotheca closterium]